MVSQTSLGREVLEVAIEIEKNGRSFYEFMAKQAKGSEVWDTFTFLAGQEQKHEETFREMLNRLGGYQPAQAYPGEHYQYIKDLADSEIFVGDRVQAVLAREMASYDESLDIAIGFEKDSILLYSEIRGFVPKDDQDIVEKVVFEEKTHLRQLMDLKKAVGA
ncbi:MAG: hypothetical protein A2Y60_04735 [Chloroflexi bacterium RBG_13_54_9]|nr:MAG: hypothetical protein A2Y60_04735 [Chloroflexi bacterium RBG_13_54_9]